MKQKISMLVAMVLALSASGGEHSSGGRIIPPRGIAYLFQDKPNPKADWPAFEVEYGADLKSIEDIASQELSAGKLASFSKDVITLEKVGPRAHAPKDVFVVCVSMGDYAEQSRVTALVVPKLKHSLGQVMVDTCDKAHIQSRYRNSSHI